MIEDAVAGVMAGRRGYFGVVVGVDRRDDAAALGEAGADVVVTDLAELELTDVPGGVRLSRRSAPPTPNGPRWGTGGR